MNKGGISMIKIPKTYRIYTKKIELSPNYFEVFYEEYNEDGNLICKGSEDFSIERYNSTIKAYELYSGTLRAATGIIIYAKDVNTARAYARMKYGNKNSKDLEYRVMRVRKNTRV